MSFFTLPKRYFDCIRRKKFMVAEALSAPYSGPAPELLRGFGNFVIFALQPRIKSLCEWLYPSNPGHVTASELDKGIFRDSCDPGAADVIASGDKLPSPATMNSLLDVCVEKQKLYLLCFMSKRNHFSSIIPSLILLLFCSISFLSILLNLITCLFQVQRTRTLSTRGSWWGFCRFAPFVWY